MITANEARELVTKWHDGRGRRIESFMMEEMPEIEARIRSAAATGDSSLRYYVQAEVVDEATKTLTNASFKVEVTEAGIPCSDCQKVLTISWGE